MNTPLLLSTPDVDLQIFLMLFADGSVRHARLISKGSESQISAVRLVLTEINFRLQSPGSSKGEPRPPRDLQPSFLREIDVHLLQLIFVQVEQNSLPESLPLFGSL